MPTTERSLKAEETTATASDSWAFCRGEGGGVEPRAGGRGGARYGNPTQRTIIIARRFPKSARYSAMMSRGGSFEFDPSRATA